MNTYLLLCHFLVQLTRIQHYHLSLIKTFVGASFPISNTRSIIMVFAVKLSPILIFFKPYSSHAHGNLEVKCCTQSQSKETTSSVQIKKQCLRYNTLYSDQQNSPVSCSFHGHTNGMLVYAYFPLSIAIHYI